MANALFANFKNIMLGGGVHGAVDLDDAGTNIKIMAADHGVDTPVVATDQDEADITGTVFKSAAVANKTVGTVAAGVFDHDNLTQAAVSGASFESLVWYKDSGTPSTSPLIVFFDVATGLPFTPSGGDVIIQLNTGGLIAL